MSVEVRHGASLPKLSYRVSREEARNRDPRRYEGDRCKWNGEFSRVYLPFYFYVYLVIYEYIGRKSAQSTAILLECKVLGIVGIYKLT